MTFVRGASFSGARARFTLGGKYVGFALGCEGGEQIMRQPLRTLGSLYVREHVPTAYDMSFSASFARLIGQTLKSMGLWPKHQASSEDFLRALLAQAAADMSALIEDPVTGSAVYRVESVVPMSYSWSVDSQGLAIKRCVFAGVRMLEEGE